MWPRIVSVAAVIVNVKRSFSPDFTGTASHRPALSSFGMHETWRRRVERARELAAADSASRSLLAFYGTLLRAQTDLHDALRARRDWRASGALDCDLPIFRDELPSVLRTIMH